MHNKLISQSFRANILKSRRWFCRNLNFPAPWSLFFNTIVCFLWYWVDFHCCCVLLNEFGNYTFDQCAGHSWKDNKKLRSCLTSYWIEASCFGFSFAKMCIHCLFCSLIKSWLKLFHATTQKVKPCQPMKYQFHP